MVQWGLSRGLKATLGQEQPDFMLRAPYRLRSTESALYYLPCCHQPVLSPSEPLFPFLWRGDDNTPLVSADDYLGSESRAERLVSVFVIPIFLSVDPPSLFQQVRVAAFTLSLGSLSQSIPHSPSYVQNPSYPLTLQRVL